MVIGLCGVFKNICIFYTLFCVIVAVIFVIVWAYLCFIYFVYNTTVFRAEFPLSVRLDVGVKNEFLPIA